MFLVSHLINAYARLAGPRTAHELYLRRLERWRTFEAEYFLLDHLVDKRRASVDVGGNEGIYAGRLSRLCPHVHCFEPIPWMADALAAKLRANVSIHRSAATNCTGRGVLKIPYDRDVELHGTSTIEAQNPLPGSTHYKEVPCELVRLDDVINEPVGFMKVDVEGHELAVLQGAERILRNDRPVLLVESENRHNPDAPESIIAMLNDLGYGGFFLEDGRLRPLSAFKRERDQDAKNLVVANGRFERAGTYVNNFIFLA
jgi:FkbM family methyltransferase